MFPDLTVFWVIFFVMLTGVILNGLIIKPLLHVMQARESAVKSARELAETASSQAQAATAEFTARTHAAREAIYREMEEKRRRALDRRAELLAGTRAEAEAQIREATERLRNDAAAAQASLDVDSEVLAREITERVLGRRAS